MNNIFKKMVDVSRKYKIDRFIMKNEYVIGGYDLAQEMDYDKWVLLCKEIKSEFADVIDETEYYNRDDSCNPPFSFCIKSSDGNYYFEDNTLSFLTKKSLKTAQEMLDLIAIPYVLEKDCIRIDKSILKNQENELLISIMDSDGDCDGLDAFQYVLSGEVDYCSCDFYDLLKEFSPYLNCSSLVNDNLYYDEYRQCLTRRKDLNMLKELLEVNNISFSQKVSDILLVNTNENNTLELSINKANKYVTVLNSDKKEYEYEAELILDIKNIIM